MCETVCMCVCVQRREHLHYEQNIPERNSNFSVFAEDVSNNREILPDIIVFVMCGAFY